MRNASLITGLIIAAASAAGISGGCSSPTSPSEDLRGGAVATFDVSGQRFKAFVTNAQAIADLFALQNGQSTASIPNGRILRGPGAGDHNAPYDWHLDPTDIEMADATIEVCDGAPAYVQAHVAEYVDVIGRYCPWGASLVSIQDYR
jgi:hypothetical protein